MCGRSPALKATLYSVHVTCDLHYFLRPVNGSSNSISNCSAT